MGRCGNVLVLQLPKTSPLSQSPSWLKLPPTNLGCSAFFFGLSLFSTLETFNLHRRNFWGVCEAMTVGTHQLVEGVNKWGTLRCSWVGLLVKSGDSYLDLQSVTEIHAQVALSTCCFSLARLSPGYAAMPMPTVFWMGQNSIGPREQHSASLGKAGSHFALSFLHGKDCELRDFFWRRAICHMGSCMKQVKWPCFLYLLQCGYSWIFGSTGVLEPLIWDPRFLSRCSSLWVVVKIGVSVRV